MTVRLVTSLATALSLSLAACYGAAPPPPIKVPLPPQSGGELLDVHTESKTTIENVQHHSSTCPQGHSEGDPACVVTTYTVAEPVTRTHSTAALDGKPVSLAQFRVLTDAEYDHKLARLDELTHHCHRANTPRYAGMALVLGGLVAFGLAGKLGTAAVAVGYAGIGGGLTSYAFGYWGYGGKQCNEANALYRQINYGAEEGDVASGADAAREMADLAAQFNARTGHAAAPRARATTTSMRMR